MEELERSSAKVFKVVREVGQPPGPVDLLAGGAVHLGHGAGAAAEHTDLAHLQKFPAKYRKITGTFPHNKTHIAVLLLHKAQEGDHVGAPKVVGRLEVGEEAAAG